MKSAAAAQAQIKGLKERLEQRGLVCVQSVEAEWPKLTIGAEASIKIESISVSSKDIIGQSDSPYTPHKATLAMASTCSQAEAAKIMLELAKNGVKVEFKAGSDLAAAEAASGEVMEFDVCWASKGI